MRPDMHEVVIERPRGGAGWERRGRRYDWRCDDDEALGKRESTSRRRGGTKYLRDLLSPLRRFLEGAVGRPWDDVYRELRAGLSPDSLLHMHILEHVEWMLGDHGRLFVCPRTARLCRTEGPRSGVRDPARGDVVTVRRFLLRRVGRAWAEVERELMLAGSRRHDNLVTVDVVRVRRGARPGRVYAWRAATDTRAAGPGELLPRGRLYVESGVLGIVG